LAKERGLEWWTAQQINKWERARRGAQWTRSEDAAVSLHTVEPLPEATLLFLGKAGAPIAVDGRTYAAETTTRWGFEFQAVTIDVNESRGYAFNLS
jgi:hypothetical protein